LIHSDSPRTTLHSLPTRRSSDLRQRMRSAAFSSRLFASPMASPIGQTYSQKAPAIFSIAAIPPAQRGRYRAKKGRRVFATAPSRSEEHTTALQSRFELICRLLLY